MEVSFRHRGNFKHVEKFLNSAKSGEFFRKLDAFGKEGVAALSSATPVDSGLTSESWSYEIINDNGTYSIVWNNSNVNDGVNIAVILQYGHGTRNGGYVKGRDYINPAIQPVFDKIAEDLWREMKK